MRPANRRALGGPLAFRFATTTLALCIASPAFASTSILGFSIGEDNISLAAIAASAAQQVAILKDLVSITNTTKENIAFVKDVYETGNDVINMSWQDLADGLSNEIERGVPEARTIRQNSEAVITNRVPRGNRFRRLVGVGMGAALDDVFGSYAVGKLGERQALLDYEAVNLSAMADRQVTDLRAAAAAKRNKRANEDCEGGLERCQRAAARMSVEAAQTLREMQQLAAQRAKLEALEAADRNAERKADAVGVQQDMTNFADSLSRAAQGEDTLPIYTADGVQ